MRASRPTLWSLARSFSFSSTSLELEKAFLNKGLCAASRQRWTATCSVPTRILASANRFDESSLKWDSRFWERQWRAEISGGGEGWSGEESISAFLASAVAYKVFFLLFSWDPNSKRTDKKEKKKILLY